MLMPSRAAANADNAADTAQIKLFLRALFARCLNLAPAQIDDDSSFFSLGLTSLIHHEVLSVLTRVAANVSSTVLFEHPNLALLSEHLAAADPVPTVGTLQRTLDELAGAELAGAEPAYAPATAGASS